MIKKLVPWALLVIVAVAVLYCAFSVAGGDHGRTWIW